MQHRYVLWEGGITVTNLILGSRAFILHFIVRQLVASEHDWHSDGVVVDIAYSQGAKRILACRYFILMQA